MLDHRGTKIGQPAPDPRGQINGVGLAPVSAPYRAT
jgi:hypothetical protein